MRRPVLLAIAAALRNAEVSGADFVVTTMGVALMQALADESPKTLAASTKRLQRSIAGPHPDIVVD